MADLDPQEKIALINANLQEVLRPDIIENAIVKENRPLVIYWGEARGRGLPFILHTHIVVQAQRRQANRTAATSCL